MEEFDTIDWGSFSQIEKNSILEAVLSLGCMSDSGIRESIIAYDESDQYTEVCEYSEEEVFSKYMEFNEQMGTPLNLTEYLSEMRECEYESQSEDDSMYTWDEYEKSVSGHALDLLRDYESKHPNR